MFMPRSSKNFTMEQKVQFVFDESEIRNVIYRDCRAKGRADAELLKTCFFDDAIDHHQPFFEAKFSDFVPHFEEGSRGAGEMIQYFAPQILIDLDGDLARVESYIISAKTFYERAANGDKIVRLSGMRQLDRFERRDGEWRVAERWFVGEWGVFHDVPPLTAAIGVYGIGTEPGFIAADPSLENIPFSRDRTDPSYHF